MALNSAPTLDTIADVTILAGAPLNVALHATDPDGDPLTFKVTSANTDKLTPYLHQGNPSLKMSVRDYGDLEFQLFNDWAPNTAERIGQLAHSGFYNGVTFHRVIRDFMIQGGDPTGDGTGGSGVEFDDEFHPYLQFTGPGILAMAKSDDDRNDSQFFITTGATRHLDFNHSIFGFLTQGSDVLEEIENVELAAGTTTPKTPIVITSADTFTDNDSGVATLIAPEGATGFVTVTVEVDDGQNHKVTKTFRVTIQADSTDNNPYLDSRTLPQLRTLVNTPITLPLAQFTVDVDAKQGNADSVLYYSALAYPGNGNMTVRANTSTGMVTITPMNGIIGAQGYMVGVRKANANLQGSIDVWDRQVLPLLIVPPAPAGVQLLPESDSGSNNSDRLTNLDNTTGKTLRFRVTGVTSGNSVRILADGQEIGRATAAGDTVVVTTSGASDLTDGEHTITAVQSFGAQQINVGNLRNYPVDLVSDASAGIQIKVDTTGPQFVSTAKTSAVEEKPYEYDVQTNDETLAGAAYSLTTAPTGMTIDPATGRITWRPAFGQRGTRHVVVAAADKAGNSRQQEFDIQVSPGWPVDFLQFRHAVTGSFQDTFVATRAGRLTVEALYTPANGDVGLVLLDDSGAEIARSNTHGGHERIDLTVAKDQVLRYRLSGANSAVTVRLTNLLVDSGNTLTVYGTAAESTYSATRGNDTFALTLGASHQLTVNGVSYAIDPSQTQTITIDGLTGNDTATVTGGAGDDVAKLWPGKAELAGNSQYQVNAERIETITLHGGGGNNSAEMNDSAGNDILGASPGKATLSGPGYKNQVIGFQTITAVASQGNDTAKLYDSNGNDTFTANPTEASLVGASFSNTARSFDAVHAFASAGGADSADFHDSTGNDKFVGSPLESSLSGNGFYSRAKFFDQVTATATDGNDQAELLGSAGDDTLVAHPDTTTLSGAGFSLQVQAFDTVRATAKAGGADTAELHGSAGNDQFSGSPRGGQLTAAGATISIKSFQATRVFGEGGADVAKLYGTADDDTLDSAPAKTTLSSAKDNVVKGTVEINDFSETHSFAGAGGTDTATLHDSANDDHFYSWPNREAGIFGSGFYNRVKYFTKVNASATPGHLDIAELTGSSDNDIFTGDHAKSTFVGTGFDIEVTDFAEVHATAGAGGTDFADLFDSPDDDTFIARPRFGELSGNGVLLRVEGFGLISATAGNGGSDMADFSGADGLDTFDVSGGRADMSGGVGYSNVAENFATVLAHGSPDGADSALLEGDAAKDDDLVAQDNWAQLTDAALTYLYLIEDFGHVKATANGPTDTKDITQPLDFILEEEGLWQ